MVKTLVKIIEFTYGLILRLSDELWTVKADKRLHHVIILCPEHLVDSLPNKNPLVLKLILASLFRLCTHTFFAGI